MRHLLYVGMASIFLLSSRLIAEAPIDSSDVDSNVSCASDECQISEVDGLELSGIYSAAMYGNRHIVILTVRGFRLRGQYGVTNYSTQTDVTIKGDLKDLRYNSRTKTLTGRTALGPFKLTKFQSQGVSGLVGKYIVNGEKHNWEWDKRLDPIWKF